MVSIADVAADPIRLERLQELSAAELDALLGAAAWYAKYHERMIADLADDRSAFAVARRDRYQALHSALARFGVRLRRPPGIAPPA
jgi:hypothetical protein